MLSLALICLSTLNASSSLDISKYSVIREHELKWDAGVTWDCYLAFSDSRFLIPLATYSSPGESGQSEGFDEKSLKLSWLIPNRMLHLSWRSLPDGQGLWIRETHVLLEVNENDCVELLRETNLAVGRMGGEDRIEMTIEFEVDEGKSTTVSKKSHYHRIEYLERKVPLAFKLHEDVSDSVHKYEIRIIQTDKYEMAGNRLRLNRSSNVIDLGERKVSASELAEALYLFCERRSWRGSSANKCTDDDRAFMLRALGLDPNMECTGKVKGLERDTYLIAPTLIAPDAINPRYRK